MRLLLAVDASPASDAAVTDVSMRDLPEGSAVEVITVLHSSYPATLPMPALAFSAAYVEDLRLQSKEAPGLLDAIARRLLRHRPGLRVTTKILEGEPHDAIAQEAVDWKADRIVLGTHDRGALGEAILGSTAASVSKRAAVPIEVVHAPR